MALTAEITDMKQLDEEGNAELSITYRKDGAAIAVRKIRINVNMRFSAEERTNFINRIKHEGEVIDRTQTRFNTIQGNLVGQTITIN